MSPLKRDLPKGGNSRDVWEWGKANEEYFRLHRERLSMGAKGATFRLFSVQGKGGKKKAATLER